MKNGTKVKTLMTNDVLALSKEDCITTASQLMKQHNVGAVPITDEKRNVLGILTDRDIVIRAIADKKDCNTLIAEIMSDDVVTVKEEDTLGYATTLMAENQVRRLPVVNENGTLTGFISLGDLSSSELTDNNAAYALSSISKPKATNRSDVEFGVEIDDFPL